MLLGNQLSRQIKVVQQFKLKYLRVELETEEDKGNKAFGREKKIR